MEDGKREQVVTKENIPRQTQGLGTDQSTWLLLTSLTDSMSRHPCINISHDFHRRRKVVMMLVMFGSGAGDDPLSVTHTDCLWASSHHRDLRVDDAHNKQSPVMLLGPTIRVGTRKRKSDTLMVT